MFARKTDYLCFNRQYFNFEKYLILPILRTIPNANNLVERIRISINACLYDLVLFRNELNDREIEIPMMNINQGKTKSVIVNPRDY